MRRARVGNFIRRRLGTILVVVAVLLFLSANRIATFLTDLWWFDELGLRSVYTTVLWAEITLGVLFGLVLAVLVAGNLILAWRMRPFFVPQSPQQAIVERYRQMVDPYLPWVIAGIAILFGVTSGAAVASQWEPYLLWANAREFGTLDPQFGRDVGFYVFELPWLSFMQTWLFTSLLLVSLLTVGAHYLLGGIRPESKGDKILPNVRVHLSLLLAALLAIRAWGYWLDRFMLNYSPRGQVTGASFTDVNAELPALNLLIGVSVIAILMVLVSIRRRGFLLPGAAIGLLVLASILLQGAYPAAIQRLRVDPQELARESEFIGRNIESTRVAYGMEDAEVSQFPVTNDLDEAELEENEVTLSNVRLWDPGVLETTYAQLQALRPYYQFIDVDVDRYVIDGVVRQVMLSARELQVSGLQAQARTWQNETLTYTHGFGVVASQVNTANREGQPVFLTRDIPPAGVPEIDPEEQPGIYFGEVDEPAYSIVRTEARELDYENPETLEQVTTSYAGAGGVPIGGYARRLAFALRFSDPNFVLSGLLREDSKVIFKRDIRDRVRSVAPYLEIDRDPYPVVLDGRVLWVQDAYTTSNYYPYSQRRVLDTGGSAPFVNYVRNSVKAVVDAYDGEVTLYVVDDQDPLVQAWSAIFPEPYAPMSEAPAGLTEHLRYPQDLFQLQSDVYRTYHIENIENFYSKADEYDLPPDVSLLANRPDLTRAQAPPLQPYYLLMRLPGEENEEFVLIQPYLARGKENMVAWLAARSDAEHYGELFAVQFPSNQTILGPSQAQARIEQEDEIAEYITLRDQAGSQVIRGNLLVLPIGDSILYVEPLFLQSGQAEIPELARVVVVMGSDVAMEPSLAGALAELVGADEPVTDDEPVDGAPEEEDEGDELDADQLLVRALEAFVRAEEALREGRLGDYQRLVEQGQDLVRRAAEARGVAPEPSPSPSPAEGGGAGAGEEATPEPTATEQAAG